jgi:hypothetical protein
MSRPVACASPLSAEDITFLDELLAQHDAIPAEGAWWQVACENTIASTLRFAGREPYEVWMAWCKTKAIVGDPEVLKEIDVPPNGFPPGEIKIIHEEDQQELFFEDRVDRAVERVIARNMAEWEIELRELVTFAHRSIGQLTRFDHVLRRAKK